MINVYDIIINLSDNNRIYEPFEWDVNDCIEHIKKIPMIRINTKIMEDIINTNFIIHQEILKKINKKCVIYNEKETKLEYACLFTDTNRVVAVEFDNKGKSIYKSYLLLDEEEEIIDISEGLAVTDLSIKILKKYNNNDCLTRSEQLKQIYILKEIKNSYISKNFAKIDYLYDEIYKKSNKSSIEKYNILINDIRNNFSFNHNEIYNILRLSNKKRTTN